MATFSDPIISSGSLLIGNPIIVPVTAGNFADVSFLRVKMKVEVWLYYPDSRFLKKEIILSSPATSNETVRIDISSALRSVMDYYEYQREMTSFPTLQYDLTIWDEYMHGGEKAKSTEVKARFFKALPGSFPAMERFFASEGIHPVQFFSSKPKSGEVVASDEPFVLPVPYPTPVTNPPIMYPSSAVIDLTKKSGSVDIMYSSVMGVYGTISPVPKDFLVQNIYVVSPDKNRFSFYFRNRMQVIETITAICLPEVTHNMKSTTHILSVPETFNKFSRSIVRKRNPTRKYKMSSGPLNREWLEWWLDEFLMTEQAWVRIDGKYLPCNILADENNVVCKHANNDLLEVTFTVEIDL